MDHGVPEPTTPTRERRGAVRNDRRKLSRSGRRANDPHTNWRRLAWLFAAYATYLSIRSLPHSLPERMKAVPDAIKSIPDAIRKIFRRGPIEPA